MTLWVKGLAAQAWGFEFNPWNPCNGRKTEWTPTSLSSALHMCTFTHTYKINKC